MITYSYSDDGMERRTYHRGELVAIHIWSGMAWREPIELMTVAQFCNREPYMNIDDLAAKFIDGAT